MDPSVWATRADIDINECTIYGDLFSLTLRYPDGRFHTIGWDLNSTYDRYVANLIHPSRPLYQHNVRCVQFLPHMNGRGITPDHPVCMRVGLTESLYIRAPHPFALVVDDTRKQILCARYSMPRGDGFIINTSHDLRPVISPKFSRPYLAVLEYLMSRGYRPSWY